MSATSISQSSTVLVSLPVTVPQCRKQARNQEGMYRHQRLQQLHQPTPAAGLVLQPQQPTRLALAGAAVQHAPVLVPPGISMAYHYGAAQLQPAGSGIPVQHQVFAQTVRTVQATAHGPMPPAGAPTSLQRGHVVSQQPQLAPHAWGQPTQRPVHQRRAPAASQVPGQYAAHQQRTQQPHPPTQPPPGLQAMQKPGSPHAMQHAPLVQHERPKQAPIHATPAVSLPVPARQQLPPDVPQQRSGGAMPKEQKQPYLEKLFKRLTSFTNPFF